MLRGRCSGQNCQREGKRQKTHGYGGGGHTGSGKFEQYRESERWEAQRDGRWPFTVATPNWDKLEEEKDGIEEGLLLTFIHSCHARY